MAEAVHSQRREASPEPGQGSSKWLETPTFLTDEEKKAKEKPGEGEKKEEPPDISSQDPEPEKTFKTLARASLKNRIEEINNKSSSPGKFPKLKQTRMIEYLKMKSPKALKARQRLEQESEARQTKL